MKIIYKIFGLLIVLSLTTSCVFNGLSGNGNVKSEKRDVSANFTGIHVSQGIDVYLTTNNAAAISVEADENIIDLIKTEVEDGVLNIYLSKQVWHSKARRVYVSAPVINKIATSSGASVRFENTLKADKLSLKSSSGSDIRAKVDVTDLSCKASSGADIRISGITKNFEVSASSGSDIKAYDLESEYANAHASSGADIKMYTTKSISIKTSSGGDVNYKGNPKRIDKKKSAIIIGPITIN